MNILLVDDDYYIVDTVKTMIGWEAIGIEHVYTALSAGQARQILEAVPIQLILCDIEMGNESGLDLMEWVRTQGSAAKVIFLTSYADFAYAQKAVMLQSFNYLLKPVQFPVLEEELRKAAAQIARETAYQVNMEKWRASLPVRKESFWNRILFGGGDQEQTGQWMDAFGVSYGDVERFLYICISIYDYETIYQTLERGMFDFLLGNITQELFSRQGYEAEALFRTDSEDASRWNMVLRCLPEREGREQLQVLGEEYIAQIFRIMHSRVSCYVSGERSCSELAVEAQAVVRMQEDDVLGIQKMKFLADYEKKEMVYVEPSFSAWEDLLLGGETQKLLWEMDRYSSRMGNSEGCNSETLQLYLADFHQMLYTVLNKKGIVMNRLMKEPEFAGGRDAARSLYHCRQYMEHAVRRAADALKYAGGDRSVAAVIRDYIELHLDEELTREDFASLVFLNADYLARRFKQETGTSIGGYLAERRMAKAKELLAGTAKPVNQIAVEVGYTNFSYFAKLFRKAAGMTPNEYRKQRSE